MKESMGKQYTDEEIRESFREHSIRHSNNVFYAVCSDILGYTPLGQFVPDMGEFDEFSRRYKQALIVRPGAGENGENGVNGEAQSDQYAQLLALVREGKPIHVNGQMNEKELGWHMSMVNRLRVDTGLGVQVVYR